MNGPLIALAAIIAGATPATAGDNASTKSGVFADPNFFPIAVWLQNPAQAPRYKAMGINTYVGLWRGPTAQQLAELKNHGMKVICAQNKVGLEHKDDPTIIGWMHGDEPDNAQSLGNGKGYGPPIPPARIIEKYERMRKADPSRPVLLNLGQGVAWDQYIGRGVRRNHPEDYPEYIKGCDIVSFDIYPAVHDHPDIAGKLWFVADGVSRLRQWSGARKPVWNCIECTHISNPKAKATPQQVKAEVWMSLVRGSSGIIYFVHQFKPKFIEAGLLADAEMAAAIGQINRQIHDLAPILNSPSVVDGVKVESSVAGAPVEALVKRSQDAVYVLAVCMRDTKTTATFSVAGLSGPSQAKVLGEDRTTRLMDGVFRDTFEPWHVHLYEIRTR
jgi:hypothetical protein